MARLILLSIRDNEVAESFIKDLLRIQEADKVEPHEMSELGTTIAAYGKIEWVIARPLASCHCVGSQKSNKGWSKTKRFGWWVHTCNKVSPLVMRNFVRNLLNGSHDLLHEYKEPETVDVHVMPNADHIVAGVPARHDHSAAV